MLNFKGLNLLIQCLLVLAVAVIWASHGGNASKEVCRNSTGCPTGFECITTPIGKETQCCFSCGSLQRERNESIPCPTSSAECGDCLPGYVPTTAGQCGDHDGEIIVPGSSSSSTKIWIVVLSVSLFASFVFYLLLVNYRQSSRKRPAGRPVGDGEDSDDDDHERRRRRYDGRVFNDFITTQAEDFQPSTREAGEEEHELFQVPQEPSFDLLNPPGNIQGPNNEAPQAPGVYIVNFHDVLNNLPTPQQPEPRDNDSDANSDSGISTPRSTDRSVPQDSPNEEDRESLLNRLTEDTLNSILNPEMSMTNVKFGYPKDDPNDDPDSDYCQGSN